jgi:hypothetical protein
MRRNRDFVLPQAAQLLSSGGSQMADLLLESVSERAAIAVFAAFGLVLAVWGTLSPAIRAAPSLGEIVELRVPETA